jgi:hypothetical protein
MIDFDLLFRLLTAAGHSVHRLTEEEAGDEHGVWWNAQPAQDLDAEPVVLFDEWPSSVVLPPWLDSDEVTYALDQHGGQAQARSCEDVLNLLAEYAPNARCTIPRMKSEIERTTAVLQAAGFEVTWDAGMRSPVWPTQCPLYSRMSDLLADAYGNALGSAATAEKALTLLRHLGVRPDGTREDPA